MHHIILYAIYYTLGTKSTIKQISHTWEKILSDMRNCHEINISPYIKNQELKFYKKLITWTIRLLKKYRICFNILSGSFTKSVYINSLWYETITCIDPI